MASSWSKIYSSMVQWTASCLPQFCLEHIAGAGCPGNSGSGWPTHASGPLPAEHPHPTTLNTQILTLPILYKLLLRLETWLRPTLSISHCGWWITGSFLWTACRMYREKKRYEGERSGGGVGIGWDPSARRKRKKRKLRKERDGQAVGLLVQQRCGAPTAWA